MLKTVEQLRIALASAYPLTMIVSLEEERLERLLQRFAAAAKPEPVPVVVWNCADGFVAGGPQGMENPHDALGWIAEKAPKGLYVLKDFQELIADRRILRRLRDTAMKVRGSSRYLFVLSSPSELPDSLKALTYVVISLFPDDSEIQGLMNTMLPKQWDDAQLLERLHSALKGMSLTEAEHLLKRLVDRHSALSEEFLREVLAEKEQITRKEGILEFVAPEETLSQIGGLDRLKGWVSERSSLFSPQARRDGLPLPKGVLLMGISGCGKSLAVKVIANVWKLPLFRLDMNLVFAGVQGSAEWVFHRALEAMEAVAPAVLWIDEIEMGVAGYHEGETGSLTRIFSTFLTWMQEHRAEVFVAATANRINLLPAEILRKGRFDEVFFVDLPNEEERKEILGIHIERNGLSTADDDMIRLASATRNWNGAEIEQAVASARISALAKQEQVTQNEILATFGRTIPLSRTMEEQLKAIRSWARTRAIAATSPSKPEV